MSLHFKKSKSKKLKKIEDSYRDYETFDAYEAFQNYEAFEARESQQSHKNRRQKKKYKNARRGKKQAGMVVDSDLIHNIKLNSKKANRRRRIRSFAISATVTVIVCGMLFLLGFAVADFLQMQTAEKGQQKQEQTETEALPTYPISASIDRISVTFGRNTATEKAFTWYTPDYFEGSDVQVVELTEDEIAERVDFSNAYTFWGESGTAVNTPQERWHKATASALSANSRYAFRVGDMNMNEWSAPGVFTTAPNNGSAMVRFVCLTDTQASNEQEAQLSAETIAKALEVAKNPAFIVHSGDVTDDGSEEEQWSMILNSARDSLLKTTLVPAAGNHERRNGNFSEHFHLPVPKDVDTATGAYYSIDYGCVHLITLNTNETDRGYACFSAAQAQWLQQDIAAAKDRGAAWIIVNMHKGPYTLGTHATEADIAGEDGSRNRIAPLLEGLGVDLVLQGHDHFLSRTKPLSHGAAAEKGTTYLCLNTAGAKVYKRNSAFGPKYLEKYDYINDKTPVEGQYQNFAVITAGAKTLSGIVYEVDQFGDETPVVVDHFMIEKKN